MNGSMRIGDICDILNGYVFKSNKYVADGIRVIRITNVQKGFVEDTNPQYYPMSEQRKIEKYMLCEGDLLMSLTGNVGRVGLIGADMLPAALNQRVACLRIKDPTVIYKPFLFHLLNSDLFENKCILASKGIAQKNMSTEWLKEYRIPSLSIKKQVKIASIFDKIDALIISRKEQVRSLEQVVKSRFVELFGDPVLNPMNWNERTVIEVCDCMVPGRDKPKSFTGDIPWITIEDLIINGVTKISKSGLGLTEKEINQVGRKTIPAGSIIMSCVGNLGICSIAGKEMVINQQLHSFQCGKNVNNIFLMHYLGYRKDYMNKWASNTTVLYMNKTICNSIPVIIPPLELQNQFAIFVKQIDKSKLAVQKSLDELETLKKSLMQQYFG